MALRLVLTAEAKADLDELRAYLQPLNPKGLQNVVRAIETRILLTLEHPASGHPSPRYDVREALEPRYGFLMPYMIKTDTLYILRIYRGMRQPLDYQRLPLTET
jgi:toxin ParE1/3/4